MTNNEFLSAISDILDEKLEENLDKFKQQLDEKFDKKLNDFEQNLDEKFDKKFDDFEQNLDERLDQELMPIKNSISTMQQDICDLKDTQHKMGLLLENDVLPRLQNIESCYISTYDRYKKSVDDYETMKQDVELLKKVVAEHSEKLQKIS